MLAYNEGTLYALWYGGVYGDVYGDVYSVIEFVSRVL